MRRLGFVWLVFGAACRPSAGPPADAGPASDAPSSEVAAPDAARSPRFARPLAAVRWSGAVAVVARDRATGELAFAKIDDGAAGVVAPVALPPRRADSRLVGAAGGVRVFFGAASVT